MKIPFGGLDNQHDAQEIGIAGCTVAANVDFRNNGSIVRRSGRTATAVIGTALHSLWGAPGGTYGFVADGSTLYHLDDALAPTLVGTLPSAAALAFVPCDTVDVGISPTDLVFIEAGALTTFVTPASLDDETNFKALTSTWGGTCGCYFNERLYVGVGSELRFSDPSMVGVYDERDYILPIGFAIRSVFASDDGIWVGGASKTVFLRGVSPKEFVFEDTVPFGVLSGAAITLAEWGIARSATAYAALSTKGVKLLLPGGEVADVAKGQYYPPTGTGHTSVMRSCNGYKQLLTCLTFAEEPEAYTPKNMTVQYTEL